MPVLNSQETDSDTSFCILEIPNKGEAERSKRQERDRSTKNDVVRKVLKLFKQTKEIKLKFYCF